LADPARAPAPRRWAALDLVVRPRHATGEPIAPPLDGLLEAFLDDFSPTAIVDPPASTAGWPFDDASPDLGRRAWRVFFATSEGRDRAQAALAASTWPSTLDITPVDVEDEGWAARSQATLTAIEVGRVIVAPPWDLPVIAAGTVAPPIVIEIEPSMGFGTGHHQSTRLCLRALQAIDLNGRTVLDLGTGSGVLAIAAARLGAHTATAIDDDPDAVEAAEQNVRRNDVWAIVGVARSDLTAPARPLSAEIVLANLTGTLLARHAEAIVRCVLPGGLLIASGFTEDERFAVAHAFRDLAVVGEEREDGWVGLTLRR